MVNCSESLYMDTNISEHCETVEGNTLTLSVLIISLVWIIMIKGRLLGLVHMWWCFCDKYKLCGSAIYLVPFSVSPAPPYGISLIWDIIWTLYICEQCRMTTALRSFSSQYSRNFSESLPGKYSKVLMLVDVGLTMLILGAVVSKIR